MKSKKLSAQDKLDFLFQTTSMSEAKISVFCTSTCIYPHMFEQITSVENFITMNYLIATPIQTLFQTEIPQ